MTRGEARESPARKTREMMSLGSLGSLLACGAMIEATGGPGGPGGFGGFGESWPVLCSWVQGIVIVAEPVLVAARMMLDERVVLPVAIRLSLWQSFLLISAIVIFEQLLRIIVLLAAKWLLVGRYKEAQHDIYSLFYLRHWLVQRIADGTIIGDELVTGTCVGFHFLRNLVLKALGADVALTAVITTRVVAFDLVSVGHLATVHGKQLTAVHFGERRMILKSISVGNGAFVGTNSVLEPGCRVAAGSPRGRFVHGSLWVYRISPCFWSALSGCGCAQNPSFRCRGAEFPLRDVALGHRLLVGCGAHDWLHQTLHQGPGPKSGGPRVRFKALGEFGRVARRGHGLLAGAPTCELYC